MTPSNGIITTSNEKEQEKEYQDQMALGLSENLQQPEIIQP